MAKTRKTKKEKMRTSTRVSKPSNHNLQQSSSSPEDMHVFTFTSETRTTSNAAKTTSLDLIPHLKEDLLRTGIVIGAIIVAELILYYILTMR